MRISNKSGVSTIVFATFVLVIIALGATAITTLKLTKSDVQDENYMIRINDNQAIITDYSATYTVSDDVAILRINDNSNDNTRFACIKLQNGLTPNLDSAKWEYTDTFTLYESGEYFVYAKDSKGNVTDPLVLVVEI